MRLLFFLFFLSLSQLTFAQIHWEHVPGIIGDADLSGFAVSPDGKWYVTGEDHLYSSADSGLTWNIEIKFGIHDNIHNLQFFSDGTPVFTTVQDLVIKRDNQWVVTGYNSDFQIYNDTLFTTDRDIFYSPDQGMTWTRYIDMPSFYPAYKYRRVSGRHYLEFGIGVEHLLGEVDLTGQVLRSVVNNGIDYFFIDSCANIHYIDYDQHLILDEEDDEHYGPVIGAGSTFGSFNGISYRLTNKNLYRHTGCEGTWEFITTIQKAQDFYPISEDTFLFALEKEVVKINLPDIRVDTIEIHNGYYQGFMQEIPDGTKFLESAGSNYRLNTDGSIDTVAFRISDVFFGPHGWIYQNEDQLLTKTPVSKDGGMTWDTLPKPGAILEPISYMAPMTEDIVVYTNYAKGTVIQYADGSYFSILADSASGISHYYPRCRIVGDLLFLLSGSPQYVSTFNLITHEFTPLIFYRDISAIWLDMDNEGTVFYVTNQQKVLNVAAYPYNEVRTINLPPVFKNATAVDRGYLVNAVDLVHISKEMTMTEIPVDELDKRQILSVVYGKSGRWILTTFSPFERFYVSTDAFSTGKLGLPIKGQLLLANEQCLPESPLPVVNWKFLFKNAGHEFLAVGQQDGDIDFVIPPGTYDVQIIPPVGGIWDECDWPTSLTITPGNPITDWNVTSYAKESCQPASFSVSAPFYRRCFDSQMFVDIRNLGVQPITAAQVNLDYSDHISLISTSVPYSQQGNHYVFELADIPPGGFIQIPLIINTSCNTSLGEQLCARGQLILADTCTTLSYADALCMEAIGSWDPNDKLVTDATGLSISDFNKDQYLFYKIRFQNTGTDTAFNIQVIDELDPGLDLKTFEMVSSSHACNFHFENSRTLVIDFPNIKLPDSSANLVGSNGFFEFRILADSTFVESDTLQNTGKHLSLILMRQ